MFFGFYGVVAPAAGQCFKQVVSGMRMFFFGSAEVAGAGDVLQGGLRAADFQHAYGRTDWLK